MNTLSSQALELLRRHSLDGHVETTRAADKRLRELMSHGSSGTDTNYFERSDFRHLPTYAIDGPQTDHLDDAFSFDPETEKIYVHVADPTRLFPSCQRDPIVAQALKRGATVFTSSLSEDNITMFPASLTSQYMSLDGEQSNGEALTFGFKVHEETGLLQTESMTIETTLISRPRRMTYKIADDDLELGRSGDLFQVYKRAALLARNRGARVSELEDKEKNSPSNFMVQEISLAAGVIAAEYARTNRVPIPYRGQRNSCNSRARNQIALRPIRHAGLGLDSYVQVTSPIRRCVDLLAHFQIKARLRKQSFPFREDQLAVEIARIQEVLNNIEAFEREVKAMSSSRTSPSSRRSSVASRRSSTSSRRSSTASRRSSSSGLRSFETSWRNSTANCESFVSSSSTSRSLRERRRTSMVTGNDFNDCRQGQGMRPEKLRQHDRLGSPI